VVDPGERVTVGCPLSTFFGSEPLFLLIISCLTTVHCVEIVLVMCLCMFYITGGMGEVFLVALTREMCVIFLCVLRCL
jgi:hypothetical protein